MDSANILLKSSTLKAHVGLFFSGLMFFDPFSCKSCLNFEAFFCFFYHPQEYIHRVGRTARGIEGRGHALLILRPEELGFLRYLKQAKVPLKPPVRFNFNVNALEIDLEGLSPLCLPTPCSGPTQRV